LKAIILTVGDEILIGQVVDTNSAWMGNQLSDLGIKVLEILSVSDELSAIKDALAYSLNKADLVLMTGGLGPTKDDITKVAISQYYGVEMKFSEETYERIVKIFEKFGKKLSPSHMDQCNMPNNATLLKNKLGTAPGMLFKSDGKLLVSMPGVPFEMKSIFTEELTPILKNLTGETNIIHQTIMTAGEGESFIADTIEPLLADMPSFIKLAYLPTLGAVRLRLSGINEDRDNLQKQIDKYTDIICHKLGSLVVCKGDVLYEKNLMNLFTSKNLTLSTAESCTGGYLAHKITSIPGSSAYFLGSVVSYSNDMKKNILHVKEETLAIYGAVSEETVTEMVRGLLDLTNADIGVSISGIAGPDGGTEEKPVGTIWMCVGNKNIQKSYLIKSTKDRLKNIEYAAYVAMNKVRLFVQENY
jgi:nicotinamide-nucleotide amidase